MFPNDGQTAATDLSYWLGPLSPAFAAMAASAQRATDGQCFSASEETDHHGGAAPEATGGKAAGPASESKLLGEAPASETPADLRELFHALNNQLGVILTYAELLEAKAPDDPTRARATQIVSATIEALGTSKKIRNSVVK
jgi:hypothetical protein